MVSGQRGLWGGNKILLLLWTKKRPVYLCWHIKRARTRRNMWWMGSGWERGEQQYSSYYELFLFILMCQDLWKIKKVKKGPVYLFWYIKGLKNKTVKKKRPSCSLFQESRLAGTEDLAEDWEQAIPGSALQSSVQHRGTGAKVWTRYAGERKGPIK